MKPVQGQPIWCEACAGRIRHALGDLVECYLLLEDEKGSSLPEPLAGPDARHYSPWSPPEEQDAFVRDLLISWDTTIRELREEPVGDWRRIREPVVLSQVVTSLRRNLDWALAHDDIGTDVGREILRERGRLRERTRSGAGATRMGRACPRCRLLTLTQEPGSDYVSCASCGRLLTLAEYDDLGTRRAEASEPA